MDDGTRKLIDAAARFAAAAPAVVVEQVGSAIVGRLAVGAAVDGRAESVQAIGNPRYRALAAEFVQVWGSDAKDVLPMEAANILWSAAAATQLQRAKQRSDLVWTGPETSSLPARQTGQLVMELIDGARRRLTLSSFGAYAVAHIGQALRAAATRGVAARVVLGDRDHDESWLRWRNDQAFGPGLPGNLVLYGWPVERRPLDPSGEPACMHAKCVVADSERLFLTSANLSGNAMDLNMELGVSIQGGPLPEQVDRHFDELIMRGELVRFQ